MVTVKVWPNGRAGSNRGILAIVFEVSSLMTVRVATEHGIMGGNNKRLYWYPPDHYNLNKKDFPLHGKLSRLRQDVLKGVFNELSQPVISIANCHSKIYGGQVGRAKCNCDAMKGCGVRCGCNQKQIPCSSSCKCMGNCSYNLQRNKKVSV